MKHEKVLIIDFGSQYTQLIARRVRELNIYSEIHPFNKLPDIDNSWKAIIFSGSPHSVHDKNHPNIELKNIKGKIPLLTICYGAQFLVASSGGEVIRSEHREYGRANLMSFDSTSKLFKNVTKNSQVWMSHADTIMQMPENFVLLASTNDVKFTAFKIKDEDTYGLQFHPEVYHSFDGKQILSNFLLDISLCSQDWTPSAFVNETVSNLKNTIQNDKVILGLSGGVDSTVAAVLLNKAIGDNLHCIFVDNGLLRKNEFQSVLKQYKGMGLNVEGIDAKDSFYSVLASKILCKISCSSI